MKEIIRIDPMSYAKITGIIMAAVGLVLSVIILVFGSMFGSLAGGVTGFEMASVGVASIIVFPLLYGALGFVSALIGAIVYNAFAGAVGGVKIQFKEEEEEF